MSNNLLTPGDIVSCITALISRNKLWAGKNVRLFFIANQVSGCFTNKVKSEHYKRVFNREEKNLSDFPVCVKSISSKLFITEYAGHTKELTQAVITELIASNSPDTECVLISAGGDGTSLEVQTTLYKESQINQLKADVIKNQITILRLPLGTGNDGTDGHKIEETIELLKGQLTFTNSCAIKVYPENAPAEEQIKACGKNPKKYNPENPQAPWFAFNIASIGLDAYVVYMTNTVKQKIPGNFYHICVPLSGLVYDKDFKTGTATMEFFDKNGTKTDEITCPITLIAFGASGHRMYGGGHKVLPTNDNICYAPKVKLLRLIRDNSQFIDGSFVGTDLAYLKSGEKLRISYDQPILLQCDGEVAMLTKDHFPLIIEKTEKVLRTISSSN